MRAFATKNVDAKSSFFVVIYVNNLNKKIKLDELKKSLHAMFSQFGKILEVLAFKTLKHKGQAWVVFEDAASAASALKQMQGFPFYDKPMRIQYAKTKSDVIAKADGIYTFVPREKRKRHEERAGKKRKEQQDAIQAAMALNPAYAGAYGAIPTLSQVPYMGGVRPVVPEAPAPPNSILFIQNLPHDTSQIKLQMLFCQHVGLKEFTYLTYLQIREFSTNLPLKAKYFSTSDSARRFGRVCVTASIFNLFHTFIENSRCAFRVLCGNFCTKSIDLHDFKCHI